MPLLEAIIGNLKPKEFSGIVIDVRLLHGFTGPGNQHTGYLTVLGDRWSRSKWGLSKTSSCTGGTYEVKLQDPEGKVRTYQHYYGEPPEIGSQQTFRGNI